MPNDSSAYKQLKELVQEAKGKVSKRSIEIIAEDLDLQNIQQGKSKDNCPFHEDDTPSFNAFIDDGTFHCFGCDKHYDIIDHFMEHDGLSFPESAKKLLELANIPYDFTSIGRQSNRDYIYPYYDKSDNRIQVEEYLSLRKISKKTLDYCDVQQSKNDPSIVFNYYDENNVLTSVKYRPARKLNKDDTKCWFQKGSDNRLILYNMNRVDPTKPLIIAEGETDLLSLIECGFKNAVSVPNGANTKWIEENFEWLEQFDKIIVWSDNDKAGIKMRREACSRLGTWRTHFVSMPEDFKYENEETGESWIVKDINEVLYWYGKEKVAEFIENAQETPIEGVDNLARVDDFDLDTIEGLTPKLSSLKETVYKFLFGSVLLVTGVRGAGKSTMINQLFVCDPLNDGYNVFLFSGELGSPILRSWLERTLAGPEYVELIDDFVHKIPKEVEKKMREWYDGRVWIYCESNNNADDIINKAIATTRKYGAKIWIFDNLMTLDIGADDYNLNQKQKDFIVKLNKKAMEYGVLAVLVTHPRKLMRGQDLTTDDISGSGDLGNMAQYIMSVRRFSDKEKEGEPSGTGGFKKGKEPIAEDSEIRIMKNRYTGKIGAARLFFDYRSYRFYKDWKTELYRKYVWDKSTSYNYKEVHKERHTGPFGGSQPF